MKRVSSSVPSLEQRHGPVSRRVSVATTGQWPVAYRPLGVPSSVPSLFRPTAHTQLFHAITQI